MPKISRLFIKSGIIYFFLGMILAFVAELPFVNTGALLLPVYWHMIVVGWITQIIMGVSIWMFPRIGKDRKKTETIPAHLAFWLLNSGLILRFSVEPFLLLFTTNQAVLLVVLVSAILHISAIISYLIEIWPRVRTRPVIARRSE